MRPCGVSFEANTAVCLIISCFDYRHVFDVVFGMDEIQQNQKKAVFDYTYSKNDDFHDSQGGARGANIAY